MEWNVDHSSQTEIKLRDLEEKTMNAAMHGWNIRALERVIKAPFGNLDLSHIDYNKCFGEHMIRHQVFYTLFQQSIQNS